jgi:2-methylfumaryl-CoA hydratase
MSEERAPGNFFEDFHVGQVLRHAAGRTITEGDCSVYLSLTGDRYRLFCDAEYAKSRGYSATLVNDLLVFHVVFGQTVADVSRNAVANLGYADVRFRNPVYPGDTLTTETEVVGLRQNKNGKSGIVYVRSKGKNQRGQSVLEFFRWVMVHKRDEAAPAPKEDVPNLPKEISPFALVHCAETIPNGSGEASPGRYFEDYKEGEPIFHGAGMTIEEAEHASAARLYQNSAAVHFDGHAMKQSDNGRRLVYGGHVISIARAMQFNGLENAERILGWNSGTHANPAYAGDTIYATSRVLERHTTFAKRGGIFRLQLIALKNCDPSKEAIEYVRVADGQKTYHPNVVLDLDYFAFMPNRTAAAKAAE